MDVSVLIVEDEPSIADNITYALSTEGFKPLWASTAEAAFEILRDRDVSLVILDVGLPDANGFEVAREIRRNHEVPIIFVTARADEIDRIVGLEIGADDYVVKPFSPRELTARVKAVLRRIQPEGKAPLPASEGVKEYGPFTVDESRFKIKYFDVTLDLSRYEFRILQILIRRPGRVFSRAQLMEEAWEDPDMSLERTVDTHMKLLRQKLRLVSPEADPIVTHRGLGYSLKEFV